MNSSEHSAVMDSAGQNSTRQVYREQNTGIRVFAACVAVLMTATVVMVEKPDKNPWWPWIVFPGAVAALISGMFLVWREVTVDAEARITREAWRLFGVLTIWRRQRSLREFAAVRSQRVEVVTKGNRRIVCDVYLVAVPGAGKRLDVERFDMAEEGGSPKGIAVGRDLAQLTGLAFEDRC